MADSTNGAVVERGVVASCNASANARSACAWTSDVRAANATGPTRGEDQCPAIARQTGLLFGGRRVQRRPEVHGGGPRVVDAAAGGRPQVPPPQGARGGWKRKKASARRGARRTPGGGGAGGEAGGA